MYPDQKKSQSYGEGGNYQRYPQYGQDYRSGGSSQQDSPRSGYSYHHYQQSHSRSPHYLQHDYRGPAGSRSDSRSSYNPSTSYHQRDRHTPTHGYRSHHQTNSYKGNNWKNTHHSSQSHKSRVNESTKLNNPKEVRTVTFENEKKEVSSVAQVAKVASNVKVSLEDKSVVDKIEEVCLSSDVSEFAVSDTISKEECKPQVEQSDMVTIQPSSVEFESSHDVETTEFVRSDLNVNEITGPSSIQSESPQAVETIELVESESDVNNLKSHEAIARILDSVKASNMSEGDSKILEPVECSVTVLVPATIEPTTTEGIEVEATELVPENSSLETPEVPCKDLAQDSEKSEEESDLELVYSDDCEEPTVPLLENIEKHSVITDETQVTSTTSNVLTLPEIVISNIDCDTKIEPVPNVESSCEVIPEEEELKSESIEVLGAVQSVETDSVKVDEKENDKITNETEEKIKETLPVSEIPATPVKGQKNKKDADELSSKLDDLYITPVRSARKSRVLIDSTNIVESSSIQYIVREVKNREAPTDVVVTPVRRSTRKKAETPSSLKDVKEISPEQLRKAKIVPNPFLK